jgi:hypothetical protein
MQTLEDQKGMAEEALAGEAPVSSVGKDQEPLSISSPLPTVPEGALDDRPSETPSALFASPGQKNFDPMIKKLRRGDLVRISEAGIHSERRFRDRQGQLGRVSVCHDTVNEGTVDVEWILGGKSTKLPRNVLLYTTATQEGMTDESMVGPLGSRQRRKRKQPDTIDPNPALMQKVVKKAAPTKSKATKVLPTKAKKASSVKEKPAILPKTVASKKKSKSAGSKRKTAPAPKKTVEKKLKQKTSATQTPQPTTNILELYEKHRREFERIVARLEKVDQFGWFWDPAPVEYDEQYETVPDPANAPAEEAVNEPKWNNMRPMQDECGTAQTSSRKDSNTVVDATLTSKSGDVTVEKPTSQNLVSSNATVSECNKSSSSLTPQPTGPITIYPSHPPYNWEMVRRRMANGRYVLDRERKEAEERVALLRPYYKAMGKKTPKRQRSGNNTRVVHPKGVNWDLFKEDVLSMCRAAIEREGEDDSEARGSVMASATKVKDAVCQAFERTGSRQMGEMEIADLRYKFSLALEKSLNEEAAMQSWRKSPYPERCYDRLSHDVVCAGLSELDEHIATYELRTNLPDRFVGISYRYDDTGQSEAWMKSVVDETESLDRKRKSANEEKQAALALAGDDGVTRAQVYASMQSLLIGVQDKVMTDLGVLKQPELRSANWFSSGTSSGHCPTSTQPTNDQHRANGVCLDEKKSPEVVEQPVWGMDCYTRRNIASCLETDFDPATALHFIEKWLLPAINACPIDIAHKISNAARILEGLPFESMEDGEYGEKENINDRKTPEKLWAYSPLGKALREKIKVAAPVWLTAAAYLLRKAYTALGPDFFRVHPKGHGSVLLNSKVGANTLVTFYRGEVYPSWRWGEKMDAIEITQSRKALKPALPDFYNMALERPQIDPRGYGLLFVDASRKAGHGSSLSHSCAPTCEVRVTAVNGELTLAMTTLRELEMGEELTFDYNAVTESLNEYRSAVCLCGYGKCRGSFLHFATADCYQLVLNRNAPIATRFANLVKGSMKQVMSDEDTRVLHNHGFLTAAFGAISVNRRNLLEGGQNGVLDTLDIVPVWLRTFVADTLRYIEYERRALPIALICDHVSSAKRKSTLETASRSSGKAPTKPEPPFFYFCRSEVDLLKALLKKDGFPDSVSGMQLNHAIKKVGSNYWQGLTEEKKEYWKKLAEADFQRRKKVWHKSQTASISKGLKTSGKTENTESKTLDMNDLLHASDVSFPDADSEGVSAMEQRIQQLTQALSRIGRVLDRHRELVLEEASNDPVEPSAKSLLDVVHAPLKVCSDLKVIWWLWNGTNGVVPSLFECIESARYARPELLEKLILVRTKYGHLDSFSAYELDDLCLNNTQIIEGRRELAEALMEFRKTILDELRIMAKEFRNNKICVTPASKLAPDHVLDCATQATSELPEFDKILFSGSRENNQESTEQSRALDEEPIVEENASSAIARTMEYLVTEVERRGQKAECQSSLEIDRKPPKIDSCKSKSMSKTQQFESKGLFENSGWLEHYNERFVLHACADLLLFYARTKTFFEMNSYKLLESTPIEVYARELGNAVPRSAIDANIIDRRGVAFKETAFVSSDDGRVATSNHTVKTFEDATSRTQKISKLCSPDDIVAEVTVTYNEDYVLSQLLQWYNGGIGLKPGMPDMIGCVVLPSIPECFSSEMLEKSNVKPDKRTTYETKIRPRLIEWLQDPFQRGNPWPDSVKKAFLRPGSSSAQLLLFGSPVIDFLATGDESSILDVLRDLNSDNKIESKSASAVMLSSVDKGRPAQAISTWVQCENPVCLKWRKVPWHVDVDLLPEKFYCKDNAWNPNANSCTKAEDDWDNADAMVGRDGKVEGSPIRKKKHSELSPIEESSFTAGGRYMRASLRHYGACRCD